MRSVQDNISPNQHQHLPGLSFRAKGLQTHQAQKKVQPQMLQSSANRLNLDTYVQTLPLVETSISASMDRHCQVGTHDLSLQGGVCSKTYLLTVLLLWPTFQYLRERKAGSILENIDSLHFITSSHSKLI